ncbi:hypothetical protein [Gloeobacter kilaueensis]|uniref:Uncharacterized protein n=1 Tax=Gloeobacter kilaueensis (strain ATCC BAA-2537 / CCAP 1431/1 / ULC 316 / JS1) TaxID=1183438 RepID=U5QDV9_GLOK1|nr:hypothetical protein [Gloeobacter kilaueensis]AGY57147.1 hypothetical protein GKIL_0901 [Gloeobacter kilaueensis JS1]
MAIQPPTTRFPKIQGRVRFGKPNPSYPGPGQLRPVGNCETCSINANPSTETALDYQYIPPAITNIPINDAGLEISIVMSSIVKENLAILGNGVSTSVAASTAPSGDPNLIVLGPAITTYEYDYPGLNLSNLVVKLRTGTSPTFTYTLLTVNNDYQVDLDTGVIKLIKTGQQGTAVLVAGAASNGYDLTAGMTEFDLADNTYFVSIAGRNITDNLRPIRAEIYKVAFDPAKILEVLNKSLTNFTLVGRVLPDLTRSFTDPEGAYWNIKSGLDLS